MVICEKYNFTFLRIPKNASTSLATFFVNNCCDPKTDKWTSIGDSQTQTNNINPELVSKYRFQHRFIHLTLSELIENGVISKEDALKKKAIGILRNPLERQLSLFFFKKHAGPRTPASFRQEFVEGKHINDLNNAITQLDYLSVDGALHDNAEFWLYDDITTHLNKFISDNKIPLKETLMNYKSQMTPKDNKDEMIEKFYDNKTRDAVLKYYEGDYALYQEMKNNASR